MSTHGVTPRFKKGLKKTITYKEAPSGILTLFSPEDKELLIELYETREERLEILLRWNRYRGCYYQISPAL
jgi:hypothetical protein